MKITITLAFCLIISSIAVAQQETIVSLKDFIATPNNHTGALYFKDTTNTLDKYFGTWVFDDGTNYLMITFSKRTHIPLTSIPDFFYDELVCEYSFKINGVEKYNTYGTNSQIDSRFANHIRGSGIINENLIYLRYGEPTSDGSCYRYKSGEVKLDYIAGATPQLTWTREYDRYFGSITTCSDGSSLDMTDFLIPANMTLIKQ